MEKESERKEREKMDDANNLVTAFRYVPIKSHTKKKKFVYPKIISQNVKSSPEKCPMNFSFDMHNDGTSTIDTYSVVQINFVAN